MFSFWKDFKKAFHMLSPAKVAEDDLHMTELKTLEYLDAVEFNTAMLTYHQNKARRLCTFIEKRQEEEASKKAAP